MTVEPTLTIALPSYASEPRSDWREILDLARAADDAGVDRIVVSDHVILGEHLEAYARPELGGMSLGKQPTDPEGEWLEPLTVLTAVAAVTERIRLGTSVLLAALRRPAVLAKTAATIDVLSQGRLDLGVGVGWQREEYEACGLSFGDRGRLLNHSLSVCRALWGAGAADFDDGELAFAGVHCNPKPVQKGGVPIWVSGRPNRHVVQRIVRFGDGWIPWGDAMKDPAPGIALIKEALDAAGRDSSGLRVVGSLPVVLDRTDAPDAAATLSKVGALVDAGITDVKIGWPLPADRDEARDSLQTLVTAFRSSVGSR